MKTYDFESAFKYIQKYSDYIDTASLGIKEDWMWTAETIYENDKFNIELTKKDIRIAGIKGSTWGTPSLEILFKDNTQILKDCYVGKSDKGKPIDFLGVFSSQFQEEFDFKYSNNKLEYLADK